jgi:hypothetical protein
MALWCRDLPLVDVPKRDVAKPVTLVMPFYANPHFLDRQIEGWWRYDEDVCRHVTLHLTDDGSPEPAKFPAVMPFKARLFRIHEDVRWNWLAARNIGMHHAAEGWCLLTDMDHVVRPDVMRAVVYGQHDPDVVYAFSREEHTGVPAAPHSASFLMTRAMFWTIGGYDEALSGHYGTDGDWRRRVAKVAPMQVLRNRLVRYEYVEDASTTRYLRKQPEDAAVKALIARRGPKWKPKVLSFAYDEVQ